MTRQQTRAILGTIKTAFSSFGGDEKPEDIAKLWAEMFAQDPVTIVMAAVRQYIQTGKYPPTVADIREIITAQTCPTVTPGEIWEECYRLLNWTISPENETRAYAHMTDVCREATLAVGGWYVLSMSPENDPHIRRTFLKAAQERLRRDHARGVPFDRSKMNLLTAGDPHG